MIIFSLSQNYCLGFGRGVSHQMNCAKIKVLNVFKKHYIGLKLALKLNILEKHDIAQLLHKCLLYSKLLCVQLRHFPTFLSLLECLQVSKYELSTDLMQLLH